MPWFKVDDQFWSHPKISELSNDAISLWVRAGSYSAQHLTDGFVSDATVTRQLWASLDDACELVRAGLWLEETGGFRFHDWFEYQPTAEATHAKRDAARERMRKVREKKRAGSGDVRANATRSAGEVRPTPIPIPNPNPDIYSPPIDQSPSVTREQVTDRREEEEIDADGFNPWAVIRAVEEHCGATITQVQAAELAAIVINRASGPVEHPTAFIKRCIEADPIGIMRDIKHAS